MKILSLNDFVNTKAKENFDILASSAVVTKDNISSLLVEFNLNLDYIKDSKTLDLFKANILEENEFNSNENELDEYEINSILKFKYIEKLKELI